MPSLFQGINNLKNERSKQNNKKSYHEMRFLFILQQPRKHDFSCASSDEQLDYKSNRNFGQDTTKYKLLRSILKKIIFLALMPRRYASSCVSSNEQTACMSNRISCKQMASHQCAKVCDILVRLNFCKRSCTDCKQRVFHQYAV